MKHIKLFKMSTCPYCKAALSYIDELKQEAKYANIEIEMIDEVEQPEIADKFDYYYVPTFYLDDNKVSEGAVTKEKVQAIFDEALS